MKKIFEHIKYKTIFFNPFLSFLEKCIFIFLVLQNPSFIRMNSVQCNDRDTFANLFYIMITCIAQQR